MTKLTLDYLKEFTNLVSGKGSKEKFIELYNKHFQKEPTEKEITNFLQNVTVLCDYEYHCENDDYYEDDYYEDEDDYF